MTPIKEGEKLMLLVKRDSRTTEEIADALGLDKSYLPKLYKMDKLPRKPLQKAMVVFQVPATYFMEHTENASGVAEEEAAYGAAEKRLQTENNTLKQEIARLTKMLEQEKSVNAHLAEALVNLSKRH
jgi:transcriptional regulator with XRE-family HTH domain